MAPTKTVGVNNYSHRQRFKPLVVDIQHIITSSAPSSVCPREWQTTVGASLRQIIGRLTGVVTVDLEITSPIVDTTNGCNNYYEDDCVVKYVAVIVVESDSDISRAVKELVVSLCAERELRKTWFALPVNTLRLMAKIDTDLSIDMPFVVKSFKLGSLIDLTQFVNNYNSTDTSHLVNRDNGKDYIDSHHINGSFERQSLAIRFRVTIGVGVKIRYKLEFDYTSIESMVVSANRQSFKLYIRVNHPPILFVVENDIKPIDQRSNYLNNEYDSDNWCDSDEELSSVVNWIREKEFRGLSAETIGKCNVYCIEIPAIKPLKGDIIDTDRLGVVLDPYEVIRDIKDRTEIIVYFAYISEHIVRNSENEKYLKDTNAMKMPFRVKYAFDSIFSFTYQASDELFLKWETMAFVEKCEHLAQIDAIITEETLFAIADIIDSRSICRVSVALDKIFERLKQKNRNIDDKEEMVTDKSFGVEIQEIRRAILTPTRVLLLPPQPILKSRFILNSNPDYTIRLVVREDNYRPLNFTVQRLSSEANQIKFVQNIVKTRLLDGLTIGGRVFEFLGTSSSQLRDNGMILYAKDNTGRTAHWFRQSVGDMSKVCRNVAKYVARLGLMFSQAMTHVPIDLQTKIDYIDDIEGQFKPDYSDPTRITDQRYVFSDGIGMLSKEIAFKIYRQLPRECRYQPSAFQIRFGGCKGMLVVNPNLMGEHIIIRNSMKKFESNDRSLGVLKLSAPRAVYLNRPLITILEQLNVKSSVFMDLLSDTLQGLADSLIYDYSAMILLQSECCLRVPYERLLLAGISFMNEPVFREIRDHLIPHRIRELKSKARIKVPMNSGRIAFGVLDETSTLQYGQVFARLSEVDSDGRPTGHYFTLTGEVMVTKFPCLHPGDVRKLQAVNVPALTHIKDCLVLPARGPRPHSDEMAGSDLDGDEYAIIWNSDLIFKGKNHEAMHFPSGTAVQLKHPAEVDDVLDFFCYYLLNNNVGLMANAYLANADSDQNGIFSQVCKDLAVKYCLALDFAKTGIVESINRNERPKQYPDFMEKTYKKSYISHRVLGLMYRKCCEFDFDIQCKLFGDTNAEPNAKFILNGWEMYEESANRAFMLYRNQMKYILNRYGVANEAALLSGAVSQTRRQTNGKNEMNDIQELLQYMVSKVFTQFRHRFNRESQSNGSDYDRRLRASAWYSVTYRLNRNESQKFYGFPFTISDELCKIVETTHSSNHFTPDNQYNLNIL